MYEVFDNPTIRGLLHHVVSGNVYYTAVLCAATGVSIAVWRPGSARRVRRIGARVLLVIAALLLVLSLSSLTWLWLLWWISVVAAVVASPWPRPRVIATGSCAAIGVSALIGAVLYEAGPALPPPHEQPRRIVVIGDSLNVAFRVETRETWPALLAERTGRPITNLARPGAKVADAHRILDAHQSDVRDALVILAIGGNDMLNGSTAVEYATGMHTLIDRLEAAGNTVLVIEFPTAPTQPQFGWRQRWVTSGHAAQLVPRSVQADVIFGAPGTTIDGLHLSPTGHERMASRVMTLLGY